MRYAIAAMFVVACTAAVPARAQYYDWHTQFQLEQAAKRINGSAISNWGSELRRLERQRAQTLQNLQQRSENNLRERRRLGIADRTIQADVNAKVEIQHRSDPAQVEAMRRQADAIAEDVRLRKAEFLAKVLAAKAKEDKERAEALKKDFDAALEAEMAGRVFAGEFERAKALRKARLKVSRLKKFRG